MPEEALDSQLAVVRSGQWQEAVFMTYALTLTFFESCLLPALRHARCEKATIFTDIDGYRSSLIERRSASAGREYAVVPVQVDSGIFHPKCTYLYGEPHDALLVGSGNLTFGGHGKNVEVLEVLSSDTQPRCFLEFADFLDALLARRDVYVADSATLERAAQRARYAGRQARGQAPGKVELLHSTSRSFADQVRDRLPGLGPVSQVLVLSPYHHPAGEPVQKLVEDTRAKRLLIGVPSDGGTTSFPIETAKSWKVQMRCVRPQVSNRKRGLHAKWWEIRGREETLALTGSINATRESFATTNNIEVGILRHLKKPLLEAWEEIDAPKYKKDDFYRGSGTLIGAVYASVDGEGKVKGKLLGITEPKGDWFVQIEDSPSEPRTVRVEEDGSVSWRDTKLLTASQTLQLEMIRGPDVARGWLSNDAVLRMPSRSRAVALAVVRMLMREETADDVDALFDYIATETAAAIADAAPKAATPASPRRQLPDDEVIERRELEFAGTAREERLLEALAAGTPTPSHRLSILDSIAALLLRSTAAAQKATDSGGTAGRGRGAESEDDVEAAARQAREDALERFNAAMEANLEGTDVTGRPLGIALRIWLNVNLDMDLRRLDSSEDAWLFARKWIHHVLEVRQDGASREVLSESFCGLVGGVLARATEAAAGKVAAGEVPLTARVVHDWLDRFFPEGPTLETVRGLAEQWAEHDLAQLLLRGEREAMLEAVQAALATPTSKQILVALLAARAAGSRYQVPDGNFSPDVLLLLDRVQRAPADRPAHKAVMGALPRACPKGFDALPLDTKVRLRLNRAVECMNCHTVILWLGSNDEGR